MTLNFKKSYPAFTLWEVIIVMLITTVVVTLSYGAYQRFTGIIEQDNKQMDELMSLSELEKDISWMVASSERVEVFGNEILLTRDQEEFALVFEEELMEIFHDGESLSQVEILDWSFVHLDEHSDLIKSFRITCKAGNSPFTLSFSKTYMKSFLYSNGLR